MKHEDFLDANIPNFRLAIDHFKTLDESNFDFRSYISCKESRMLEWGYTFSNIEPVDICFKKYGVVPCGTAACVAGEIWLEFAKTEKDRKMKARNFARKFLNISDSTADRLFLEPETYGLVSMESVKLQHVIALFERVVEQSNQKLTDAK